MGKETVVERTLSTLYLLWDLLVLLVSSEFVSDHTALTHTHTQTPILVVHRVKIILSIFAYLFSTLSVFPLILFVCSFCILIKILNCPHLWKLNVHTQKEQIKSRGKRNLPSSSPPPLFGVENLHDSRRYLVFVYEYFDMV